MTGPVERSEFDRLAARLEQIDIGGTRGVAVLAVQVQQIARDLAKHEEKHDAEIRQAAERAASARREHLERTADAHRAQITQRRWLIGLVVAIIAAVDSPLFALFFHSH